MPVDNSTPAYVYPCRRLRCNLIKNIPEGAPIPEGWVLCQKCQQELRDQAAAIDTSPIPGISQ